MCLYVHQLFQSLWRCCIPFYKSGSHIHSHIHTLWLWYTIRKFTLNAFYYSRWWFLENLHSHIFSYIISHTTSLLYNRKEQKARILLKKFAVGFLLLLSFFLLFFFCSIAVAMPQCCMFIILNCLYDTFIQLTECTHKQGWMWTKPACFNLHVWEIKHVHWSLAFCLFIMSVHGQL